MLAFHLPARLPSLPTRSTRLTCVCRRRSPILASVNSNGVSGEYSWEETPNYQSLGSGVPSSGLQQIEFIIRQDGTVEERVTGVRGKHCDKLTEKIEKAIGKVVHTEKTEEYFQEAIDQVVEKNVQKENVIEWPGAEGLPKW